MAIDELLLEEAIAHGTATLRFYQWSEPTLSLGYFQSYEDRHAHAASRDCTVVRRTTGGGAILHDQELTYSFTTPTTNASRLDHSDLVNVFHQTISAILGEDGVAASPLCCDEVPPVAKSELPFLCFQRREQGDVVTSENASACAEANSNAKIVGSAQRRRHGAILQHGSLLLSTSGHAPELKGCADFGGNQIDVQSLIVRWSSLLAERLSLTLQTAELPESNLRDAESFAASKFASAAWLSRR